VANGYRRGQLRSGILCCMTSWIVVIALYALGMCLFHILGGLGAAAEFFQKWGEATARKRYPQKFSSPSN
jgi:hypothetical protein